MSVNHEHKVALGGSKIHTQKRDFHRLNEQIAEYESRVEEALPFPHSLVSDLTKKHVKFLIRWIEVTDLVFISSLGHSIYGIFSAINNIFIRDAREGRESPITPRHCLDGLRNAAQNGVPQAPLFLLVAEAYLSDQYKRRHINRPRSQSPDDLDFSEEFFRMDLIDPLFRNRTEDHRKKLKRSATRLKKTVADLLAEANQDTPEVCSESGRALPEVSPLPRVVTWIEKHEFESELTQLIEEVEEEGKLYKNRPFSNRLDIPMTQNERHTSDYVYRLFDGATELIKTRWKERGAKQEAIRIFQSWGIVINSDSAKLARQRRERNRNKPPP